MPNYCQNMLEVKGKEKELKTFLKAIKSKKGVAKKEKSEFDFDSIIPMPKILLKYDSPNNNEKKAKEFKEKYGSPDWYSWRKENWGTKWNINNSCLSVDLRKEGDEYIASLSYDTAWTPAIPIIKKLATMFPKLKFDLEYSEEGCGFAGRVFAQGKKVDEKYYESEDEEYGRMVGGEGE